MYCKLDTAVIEITRSFESEYNNSPQLRFTQKTGTWELCPSPLRPSVY